MLKRFLADESGSTAMEYGLVAMLIAVALIVAFVAFGGGLQGLFGRVRDNAGNSMDSAGI